MRRSHAEPGKGAHLVARDPLAFVVHHPDQVLRLGIALFGEREKQTDRRHVVAAIISCHAVFPRAREGAGDAPNLHGQDQAAENDLPFHAPPLGPFSTRSGIASPQGIGVGCLPEIGY